MDEAESHNPLMQLGCEEYFGLNRDVGKIALADRTLQVSWNHNCR